MGVFEDIDPGGAGMILKKQGSNFKEYPTRSQ